MIQQLVMRLKHAAGMSPIFMWKSFCYSVIFTSCFPTSVHIHRSLLSPRSVHSAYSADHVLPPPQDNKQSLWVHLKDD